MLIFRALRHRNYRLFFIGQGISLLGTWMTQIATAWLVYRLTGSALMLGLIGFSSQIATFMLAPVAGVFTDRWNGHRILVVTQILSAVQSFLLALLALTGKIAVWHIIALSVAQGLVNGFDVTTRQSFVVDLVRNKHDLSNAIALNSSVFNGARLLGPPLAGILIAWSGEGLCFLVDGVSYCAVIGMLLAMKDLPQKIKGRHIHPVSEFLSGIRYAINFVPIRLLLLFVALVSFAGMPYGVLMPAFAKEVLHGDSHVFGLLMGVVGCGAFMGSIYLASRKSVQGLVRLTAWSGVIFGLALIAFSFSSALWVSCALLFMIGITMILQMAASNTVLQTVVDDDKRGRVMSLYTMAFMGMSPWGSLSAGFLASRIGVPHTFLVGGALSVMGSIFLASQLPLLRAVIHPIYVRMGILPEIASGMQTAAVLTTQPKN